MHETRRVLMVASLWLVGPTIFAPPFADAQPSGTFNTTARMSSAAVAERAKLVLDPSLASPVRASSWAFALRTLTNDSEVEIQLNLSDVVLPKSGSAFSLGLISPIDKDNSVTELADLDGMVGTTRAELAYTSDIVGSPKAHFYARVTGAAPRFEYRSTPGLTRADTRKASLSGATGFAVIRATHAFRFGARLERAYRARDEQSICTPANVGVPNAVSCESIVIGTPIRTKKLAGEGEFRKVLGRYLSLSLGVAHDFEASVTGFDLPIWLIPDAEGSFGGGFRIGYRTDGDKQPTLSVFVGQFKL